MKNQFDQIKDLIQKDAPGKKIPWWFWPLLLLAMKIDNFFAWVWSFFGG